MGNYIGRPKCKVCVDVREDRDDSNTILRTEINVFEKKKQVNEKIELRGKYLYFIEHSRKNNESPLIVSFAILDNLDDKPNQEDFICDEENMGWVQGGFQFVIEDFVFGKSMKILVKE